ncbi:MAG: hypothetical protein P4M08_12115 [Oligoflexia bacterium]|nr:hypothetical protein [Oligoflexia bacterium]
MPLLHESSEDKKFDTRMVERNVTRGVVPAADVDKFLKNLPDDAEGAEWVNLDVIAASDDIRRVPTNGSPEAEAILMDLANDHEEARGAH